MELVWPALEYLPGYVDALKRGWSPDNVRGEAATLEDLDSKNGTWVGENRVVGPTPLSDGDTIRLGLVHLVFRAPPGSLSTTKTVR